MSVLWLVVPLDRASDRGTEGYIFYNLSVDYIKCAIDLTLSCDKVPVLEYV